MKNNNNEKCALHPTREHPSRACTPRGFTALFDKGGAEIGFNEWGALIKWQSMRFVISDYLLSDNF